MTCHPFCLLHVDYVIPYQANHYTETYNLNNKTNRTTSHPMCCRPDKVYIIRLVNQWLSDNHLDLADNVFLSLESVDQWR